MDWTYEEMMAIALARQVEDGKTYIVGTGLPLKGASLAKRTTAPNAHLIFETAIFEGVPQELPTGVSDLRINHQASVLWPQYRYLGFQACSLRDGGIAAGFLGGAQIDPYGNLNSTCIGDYQKPATRFSGSGGANGIATNCNTIITMKHQKRRFVEHVDYITSPGWIDGPDGRKSRGLNPELGPLAVITDLGILRFGEDKRCYLAEYYPSVSVKEILENTGFALDASKAVEASPPDAEMLEVLRRMS